MVGRGLHLKKTYYVLYIVEKNFSQLIAKSMQLHNKNKCRNFKSGISCNYAETLLDALNMADACQKAVVFKI